MTNYWITVSVPGLKDEAAALRVATEVAETIGGDVVQVEAEPPQGSTIVGDYNY